MSSLPPPREIALQVLCTLDRQPELSPEQALTLYFGHLATDQAEDDAPAAGDVTFGEPDAAAVATARHQADRLVKGVRARSEELDALITRSSRNWRLERMSWVDRNVLRLFSFELQAHRELPARTLQSDAVEIARRFGTGDSPAFVSGVLERVRLELQRAD